MNADGLSWRRTGGVACALLLGGAVACDEKKVEPTAKPVVVAAVQVRDAAVERPPIVEISLTSSVPEALEAFKKGRDHAERGRVDAAVTELERAVQLDKRFALALAYLGFFTTTQEGNAMLDRAVALAEGLPPSEKLLVEHLRSWRHADTAALAAQRKELLQVAPTDWRVHLMLGMGATEERLWEPAAASFKEAIAINPGAIPAYNLLGSAQMNLGRYDEAIETLAEGTRREPNESSAFDALGEAQLRTGKLDAAEASFQKAADLSQGAVSSLLGVAQARFLRGDFEGGRKALAAIQSGPGEGAGKVEAGTLAVWSLLAERRSADALKAVAALEKVAKANKQGEGWAAAPILRAVVLIDSGKHLKAADEASAAIDRVGQAGLQGEALARLYRTALIWRLIAELKAGRAKDADKTFVGVQKAASLIISPESTSTRAHAAGLISRSHGETQIALQQLLECAEDDFFCRVDLAEVQEAMGDAAAASKTRDDIVKANRRDGAYLYARALAQVKAPAAPEKAEGK